MRRAILAALIFFVAPVCAFAQQNRAASDSAAASGNGDATVQLLKKLVDAPGPSGFEEPVARIVVEEMKPYAAKISHDGLGSA